MLLISPLAVVISFHWPVLVASTSGSMYFHDNVKAANKAITSMMCKINCYPVVNFYPFTKNEVNILYETLREEKLSEEELQNFEFSLSFNPNLLVHSIKGMPLSSVYDDYITRFDHAIQYKAQSNNNFSGSVDLLVKVANALLTGNPLTTDDPENALVFQENYVTFNQDKNYLNYPLIL